MTYMMAGAALILFLMFAMHRWSDRGRVAAPQTRLMPLPASKSTRGGSIDAIIHDVENAEVLIGPSVDHPVLRISALDVIANGPSTVGRKPVPPAALSRLNAIVGAAGPLATALASRGNLMQVQVAGELARAAGTNSFRGFVTKGGRIVEQAILDPSSISSVATGTFVFQLVSIVVAQKHLADIDRRLKDLQMAVASVQDFLEDGRRAEITSSIAYLQQVAWTCPV